MVSLLMDFIGSCSFHSECDCSPAGKSQDKMINTGQMQFGKLAVEMIELMATTELMETITQGRVTTTLHKCHENSFKVLAVPLVNQARQFTKCVLCVCSSVRLICEKNYLTAILDTFHL